MSLTQVTRLRLEGKDFQDVFQANITQWTQRAESARAVMSQQLDGAEPSIDDIKKVLVPMLEINPALRAFLDGNKLTQKYWIGDSVDYILDKIYQPKLTLPQ